MPIERVGGKFAPCTCAQAGCRKSPQAGSFARKASFRLRAGSIAFRWKRANCRRIFSPIPTAKASSASSRSAVSVRGGCSSTSRNRRFRRHASLSFLPPVAPHRRPPATAQVILATQLPMLMACPNARLLQLTKYGLEPMALEDTSHFRLLREFCLSPRDFVDSLSEE